MRFDATGTDQVAGPKGLAQLLTHRLAVPRGDIAGLANQAVNAGGNLAVSIVLMRSLSTAEFGLYAVAASAILLWGGINNAVVTSQFVVNAPDRTARRRALFAANMHLCLWLLGALPLLMAALAIAAGSSSLPAGPTEATAAAALSFVLRDFFTRYFFSEGRPASALWINALSFGVLIAALAAWEISRSLNLASALWIIAAAQGAGAAGGALIARLPLTHARPRRAAAEMRRSAAHAGWALSGVATSWIQSQAYVYACLLAIGPEAAGIAAGAKILVSPLANFVVGLSNTALPRMVMARPEGRPAVQAIARRYSVILLFASLLYLPFALLPFVYLLGTVVAPDYVSDRLLIGAWWAVSLVQALRFGTSTAALALRRFRALALCGAASALVTVLFVLLLGWSAGASGAVMALAVGELALWILIRRSLTISG